MNIRGFFYKKNKKYVLYNRKLSDKIQYSPNSAGIATGSG